MLEWLLGFAIMWVGWWLSGAEDDTAYWESQSPDSPEIPTGQTWLDAP